MLNPDKALDDARRLGAALSAFLDEKAATLSRYSIIHLRASLEPLVRALGNPEAEAVTFASLRAYVDSLYLRYKPGTIKPVVGDIRQFFRWCRKRKWVRKNPAKRLRAPGSRLLASTAGNHTPPEENIRRLIRYLSDSLNDLVYRDLFGNLCAAPPEAWPYAARQTLRDLFIVVFLHETGARAGELWRLSSRAMDEAVSSGAETFRVISTGKTAAVALYFTPATAELWRVWQQIRPPGCESYAVVGWKDGHEPRAMSTETISRTIARQCRRAGVPPFRAHALRHAKIQRGTAAVGLAITSRLIGHSSVAVTAAYARTGERELEEAAKLTGLGYRLWSGAESRTHGSHP